MTAGAERDEWVQLTPQGGRVRLRVLFEDVSCLFGMPLPDVCAREGEPLPTIVRRCIEEIESRGMNDVGLYRVRHPLHLLHNHTLLTHRVGLREPAHRQRVETAIYFVSLYC